MRDKNGKIMGVLRDGQIGPFGGGFVTSFSMTDDATVMVHGTDVGGGYVWGITDTKWRHAVSYDSYPDLDALSDSNNYSDTDGMYAIDIAPSDGQVGYCVFRAHVFRTTNQFKTVQLVPGGYFGARANTGDQRLRNDKLKIDPVDPNTFMVGSEGQGVYYSIDGGLSLVKVAGIPDVTLTEKDYPLNVSVAVDRTSTTANGRKQHWVVWVPGSGLWETTTGPEGTWTKTAGTPTISVVCQMSIDHNGNILIAGGADGIFQRVGNTWTKVSTFQAAASTTLKNNQKVSMGFNGEMNFTTASAPNAWNSDYWRPNYPLTGGIQYRADKVQWLKSDEIQLFPSKLFADPINPAKMWLVHGTGIAWAMAPNGIDPIVWNDMSSGNAMLVTTRTLFTPEGNLLRASWDQPIWTGFTDEEINNPKNHSIEEAFAHGWDVDYVPGKSNIVVACVNYYNPYVNHYVEYSGMSKDNGKTFKKFAAYPYGPTTGGNIGFVNETEGYWIPSLNARAVYTVDGGQSWSPLSLTAKDGSTLPMTGNQGWSFGEYINKKNLYISKNEPGVAYLYNDGVDNTTLKGFWRKEAGSTTFTQVHVGTIGGNPFAFSWYMRIEEMPGMAGNLFLTSGSLDGNPVSMRSTDAGVTWSQIVPKYNGVDCPLTNVEVMGFGKPAPGSSYATIRFAAKLNGEYGFFESFDNLQTITKVGGHPAGMTYGCTGIAGHPKEFGVWYYGIGQMGWAKATRDFTLRVS